MITDEASETVKTKPIGSHFNSDNDYYCNFEPEQNYSHVPHPTSFSSEEERSDYLDNLKRTTIVEHNTAARNVETFHFQVQEALSNERTGTEKTLTEYKRKMDKHGDDYEKDLEDLLERTTELEKNLQKVIAKLKIGDSTAFSMGTVDEEFVKLEKQFGHLEKKVDKYQRFTQRVHSYTSMSTSDRVLQDLQTNIKININVSGASDDEDTYELVIDKNFMHV